ncbi:ATP-binding cassette domain-containing protein [Candidatus Microgenomates bacterium]|nr:ATP-binding cassette domain-containing protein [Candidatus Microgenomates bacterium]
MITFKNVTKKFGEKKVLNKVSFEIASGEFVFLIGPSGAGKTSIIRLAIREFLPSAGKIVIDGEDLTKLSSSKIPFLRRKVGVVFQDFKILSDKTVLENVILVREILGDGAKDALTKAEEVLEIVGLKSKKDFFPVQLSAGELQRVCMARAIVSEPKILLADEPTGNLDPATGWELIKLLDKINKMGTTVLMATHNVDIVDSFKRRVITLEKGKLIKDEKEGKY